MSRRQTTAGRRLGLRTAAAGTAALVLAVALAAPPAAAEPRRVLSFHFFADGAGFDIERESGGGSAWLAGLSLAPPGFYGAVRQYESAAARDRTFWSVYGTVHTAAGHFEGDLEPGLWASAGYEVRLDPSARGTGEIGFGLVARRGGLVPAVFIGLSLGWRLRP